MTEAPAWISELLGPYPWVAGSAFVVGASRVFKLVSGPVQTRLTGALVRMAADPEGDELAHKILKSRWYTTSGFLLDLVFSWKLPTHATYTQALEASKVVKDPA